MVSRVTIGMVGLTVLGTAAMAPAAMASHGKAGLWEVTSTMNMPNMPQLSPTQMAQMQAMGVHMPSGHSITVRRCMTAAEVASDTPPPMHNKNCAMTNVKVGGGAFSGDVACTGTDFAGQGHFSVAFDGDEHYAGTTTMRGSSNGHPVSYDSSFDGKWVSADCGSVK